MNTAQAAQILSALFYYFRILELVAGIFMFSARITYVY